MPRIWLARDWLAVEQQRPLVGVSSLSSILASTVLPQPDCPTTLMMSLLGMVKLTFLTARVSFLPWP